MKTRPPDTTPWMDAPDYGRTPRGLGFNLIVRDVPRAVKFATEVLGATATYAVRLGGAEFMFHADHTDRDNPPSGAVKEALQ